MNFLLSITILLVTVAVTYSYDFQDEYYNQILKQDLDDMEAAFDEEFVPLHPRVRRDEEAQAPADKCKKRRFRLCCGEEFIEKRAEKHRELKRECFKDVKNRDPKSSGSFHDPFSCERSNKTKKEITCVMQCVGQKRDLVDADGNLKEDGIKEYVEKEYAEAEWLKSLVESVLPKCLEDARNISYVPDKEDPLSCNPASMKFVHCLWRETQLNCPADKITDQKACDKVKDKMKRHSHFLPLRHHFDDDDH